MENQVIELLDYVFDTSSYRAINEDYIDSLPPSHNNNEQEGTILDYEPHSYGIGYYDMPDRSPFEECFDNEYDLDTWKAIIGDEPAKLRVRNCEQLLALSYFHRHKQQHEENPSTDNNARLAGALKDIFVPEVDDERCVDYYISLLDKTNILDVDFSEWNHHCTAYHHHGECLSASFLSLVLAFPNVRALRIKRLTTSPPIVASIFANFPSPRPQLDDTSGNERSLTVSEKLSILSFYYCNVFHPSDLSYLADCAIEHRVLPNLRHVQCYYCTGISYPSVVAASEVLNLDFDRYERSGRVWPQEAVNQKNFLNHY